MSPWIFAYAFYSNKCSVYFIYICLQLEIEQDHLFLTMWSIKFFLMTLICFLLTLIIDNVHLTTSIPLLLLFFIALVSNPALNSNSINIALFNFILFLVHNGLGQIFGIPTVVQRRIHPFVSLRDIGIFKFYIAVGQFNAVFSEF